MAESWRPIPEWEGLYSVSSEGRVRSHDRVHNDHRGVWVRNGRILRRQRDRDGYLRVNLCRDSERYPRTVHRLVLEAFVGPRPDGMECRHLNGDPADNRVANLAWGTPLQNNADRRRHGTLRAPRGEAHPKAKLSRKQALEIHRRRSNGERCKDLAREFGVSNQLVSRIGLGEVWKHAIPQEAPDA